MGGLPVKSWMKVETYGQTCLNLRPEAGRMAKMFLEPVSLPKYAKMAFSEMAWPLRGFIAFV